MSLTDQPVTDEALAAMERARQLRRISVDLQRAADEAMSAALDAQAQADAARREYENAGGIVRALFIEQPDQVAA